MNFACPTFRKVPTAVVFQETTRTTLTRTHQQQFEGQVLQLCNGISTATRPSVRVFWRYTSDPSPSLVADVPIPAVAIVVHPRKIKSKFARIRIKSQLEAMCVWLRNHGHAHAVRKLETSCKLESRAHTQSRASVQMNVVNCEQQTRNIAYANAEKDMFVDGSHKFTNVSQLGSGAFGSVRPSRSELPIMPSEYELMAGGFKICANLRAAAL